MSLAVIKAIHIASVAITFAFFFVRGLWMIAGSERLRQKWVRRLPPVIDTILLASAITLAVSIRQYPFVDGWLTAKVIALLLYIGLGLLALTYGPTRRIRITSWIAAQLCFLYIVAVAITRNPLVLS